MLHIIRIAMVVILIILGIPRLVLTPILQDWLFLALSALFLFVDIPFFERLVKLLEERVPRIKKPLEVCAAF